MSSHRADAKNVKISKGTRTRSARFMFGYRAYFYFFLFSQANIAHILDGSSMVCHVLCHERRFSIALNWICRRENVSDHFRRWEYRDTNSKHSEELGEDSKRQTGRKPVYTIISYVMFDHIWFVFHEATTLNLMPLWWIHIESANAIVDWSD